MTRAVVLMVVLLLAVSCMGQVQGNMALRQGNYEQAAQQFQAVLADNPGKFAARIGLARAYLYLGKDTEAAAELEKVRAAAVNPWQAVYYQGVMQILAGDTAGGMATIRNMPLPRNSFRMKQDVIGMTSRVAGRDLDRIAFLNAVDRVLAEADRRETARRRNDRNR